MPRETQQSDEDPTVAPRLRVNTRPSERHRAALRNATPIRLAEGDRNKAALEAVIDEWLVPLLVKEFLGQDQQKSAVIPADPITKALGKEGADINRIR